MIKMENKLESRIQDLMTKKVISVDVNDKIADVQHLMMDKHIRHAPVLKNGELVGILSLTDLQRMNFSNTYGEDENAIDDVISDLFTAGMVMHEKPVTINLETSLVEAVKIFIDHEFHALPVMDNHELIGIITTTDILKILV